MCGICGVHSPNMRKSDVEVFQLLLYFNIIRGENGCGVVSAQKKGKVRTFKTLGTPTDLFQDAKFQKFLKHDVFQKNVLIGHTRWPTKGTLSLESTHPFSLGSIHGVHNGTMRKVSGDYEWEKTANGKSDSLLMYESIRDKGLRPTIETSSGAYCFNYVDEVTRKVHFLRNDERPLWFARLDKGGHGALYWASEAWMLRVALEKIYPKGEVALINLPVNMHCWYQIGRPDKVESEKLEPQYAWTRTVFHPDGTGHDGYAYGGWKNPRHDFQGTQTRIPAGHTSQSHGTGQSVIPFSATSAGGTKSGVTELFQTTTNRWYPKDVVAGFLLKGCAWCSAAEDLNASPEVCWISSSEFVCKDCYKNQDVQGYLSAGTVLRSVSQDKSSIKREST